MSETQKMAEVNAAFDRCLSESMGVGREAIQELKVVREDFGGDSLDHAYFLMMLEETFGIDISESEVEGCRTVADYRAMVMGKIAA